MFYGESSTYDDDDEVEPTPGVGKVFLEAVRHHLDDHLKDEDDRERTIGVVQGELQPRPLFNMNVFHGLKMFNEPSNTKSKVSYIIVRSKA